MDDTKADDDDIRLSDLLEQWEKLLADGLDPTPQQVCRDHPHLIDRFIEATAKLRKADKKLDVDPPAAAAPPVPLPQTIGPYRIIELLGEGGMGTVFKAEQPAPLRRMVALKVVKAGFDTASVVARFSAEHQALARLEHPNIARVYDAGVTDSGRAYFVMEYLPGQPITDFCDSNKLTIRQRLELFQQACDAINHAHIKAIVHRDIKSTNVLAFMQDGKPMVKVIDFGIAKALTGDRLTDLSLHTGQGVVVGTYYSMSPEQADGSVDIDTRTDVYSLGVMLYELITGAKPFDLKTLSKAADAEIRRIIREVDPPRPSTRLSSLGKDATRIAAVRQSKVEQLTRELRGDLEWIPLKAMRKERNGRYASPLQMREDIDNYLNGRPLIAGPESRIYRVKKFAVRNARPLISVAAVILLALGGIAFYVHTIQAEENRVRAAKDDTTLALQHESEQRQEAVKQREIATDVVASSDLQQAELAAERGKWADALSAYSAARDGGSKDLHAILLGRVLSLQNLGRYADAVKEMEDGVHAHSELAEDPLVMARRGELLWSTNLNEGERLLRKAMQGNLPAGEKAFVQGLLSDSIDDSIEQFKGALAADPFRPDAISLVAILSTILGEWHDADAYTSEWMRKFPDDSVARVARSVEQALRGNETDARRILAESDGGYDSETTAELYGVITAVMDARDGLSKAPLTNYTGLLKDLGVVIRLLMAGGNGTIKGSLPPFPKCFSEGVVEFTQGAGLSAVNAQWSQLLAAHTFEQAERSLPLGFIMIARATELSQMKQYNLAAEEFEKAADAHSPFDVRGVAHRSAAACYAQFLIARDPKNPDTAKDPRITREFRKAAELDALGSGTINDCSIWQGAVMTAVGSRRTKDARAMLELWDNKAPENPLVGVWEVRNEYLAGSYGLVLDLVKDLDRRYPQYDFATLDTIRDASIRAINDRVTHPPAGFPSKLGENDWTVPLRSTTKPATEP